MAICHHLKISSSILPVNDSLSIFKNMPVLITSAKNYSASKTLFDKSIYEIAGDDADELFYSKNSVPVMIIGLGNIVFVRQLKLIWQNQQLMLIWQNQKLNVGKIFQALCFYFAYYLRVWDVLLNCMQNLRMRLLSYILWIREIISSMDKKKEMIVTIFFLGKELSMKPVVTTRNIYSFMNRGVCLHTESSTKICLQFRMNSA
jgi:hypothetical protein